VGGESSSGRGRRGHPASPDRDLIYLNLNENAFGPSLRVPYAIQGELSRVSRYADASSAQVFADQIAAYERVPVDQIVLGEILGALGLYLGSKGGPGGEPVPLNAEYRNDLPALAARVNSKARALYLISPHNPTGTVSDDPSFKHFLREVSQKAR
jgi:histidinol-phosphate aminotransferase